MKNPEVTVEYAEKIRPLLSAAQKAYGSRNQTTPAHEASRKYTELLVEYVKKGGSLIDISHELGVSYAGVRRRVMTASLPAMDSRATKKKTLTQQDIDAAIERIAEAKKLGARRYHAQLATEYYDNGVPLSTIARGLGIKNAGPLYYGVQRHVMRTAGK